MSTIRRHPDRPGVQLLDPIEGVRYDLYVAEDDVDVEQRPDDAVPVPVDSVARVHTRRLTLPKRRKFLLRDWDFQAVDTIDPDEPDVPALTDDDYILEVSSAPLKLYLQVPGSFTVDTRNNRLDIVFSDVEPLDIAIRSFHEQPAGTITVGESVRDEMEAISRFGSALKTTTPERAWPTLRGQPPLVERGETFNVPETVQRPSTGITLHVPPDREFIYPAAPLAYYLGALLEPTSGSPCLTAADRRFPIDPEAYTSELNALLQRVFLLDVAARREGMYPFHLSVHDRIDDAVDDSVDWRRLYDHPIDERVADYLAPRFDPVTTESVLPEWHLTTDVAPIRSSLKYLPWVARDLSLVRLVTRISASAGDVSAEPEPISQFLRQPNEGGGDTPIDDGEQFEASEGGRRTSLDQELSIVRPAHVSTQEHRWVGEETPLEAQFADRDALYRHLSRLPPEQEDHVISIDLVCNDEAMADEAIVEEVYGVRDFLEYDIRTHYSLTTGELWEVLQSSSDLLHYIGHVDEDGIQCVDGALDARTLDDVGIDTFLLNACKSYHQGQALLDAGSLAGVVTLANVSNVIATRMGYQLARLLNTGLRFRSALAILQQYVASSYRYIVLGAGNMQLVQSESGTPYMVDLTNLDDGHYRVSLSYYPASGHDIGAVVTPVIDESDKLYLGTGTVGPFTIEESNLVSFFERQEVPVDFQDELTWSSDVVMALQTDQEQSLADSLDAQGYSGSGNAFVGGK